LAIEESVLLGSMDFSFLGQELHLQAAAKARRRASSGYIENSSGRGSGSEARQAIRVRLNHPGRKGR
jgi:hypothetical protein